MSTLKPIIITQYKTKVPCSPSKKLPVDWIITNVPKIAHKNKKMIKYLYL
jgi:hypothetical protein